MYDWFVLFVCNVTEEPHQSQFSVWCNKRYAPVFFPRLKRQFVWSFYFFLPPSLSLPSEQSVSVATSHPSPLHPDWQMQCQTFWSRTHLPLLLHSPGQPSVNTSRICQTAKRIRTRKSGWEGEEGVRRQERKGLLEWTEEKEGQKWFKKKRKKTVISERTVQYTSNRTGDGGQGRWGVVRRYGRFTWVLL